MSLLATLLSGQQRGLFAPPTSSPSESTMTEQRLCQRCRTPIPEKRLLAKPDAQYCVRCQSKFDRRVRPEDVGDAMAELGEITPSEIWGR